MEKPQKGVLPLYRIYYVKFIPVKQRDSRWTYSVQETPSLDQNAFKSSSPACSFSVVEHFLLDISLCHLYWKR